MSGYARFVGRVGALAVALGVGVAVANNPGLAGAETGDSSSPDSSAAQSNSALNTSQAGSPNESTGSAATSTEAPKTPDGTSTTSSGIAHSGGAESHVSLAYVTSMTGTAVSVIDTATNTIIATLPVSGSTGVAIRPDGNTIYVASAGKVTVLKFGHAQTPAASV